MLASEPTPPGVVRARFTDGAGSLYPQQFPGSSGDGRAAAWAASGAASASVLETVPLQTDTDRYLRVARTGGTFDQEGVVREWSAATRPDTTFSRITFDLRLDSDLTVFNATSDSISFGARAIPEVATSNDSSFFIRAFGAATGAFQTREWIAFDGTPGSTNAYDLARFRPTGLVLQPGVTYSFTIDVYAASAAGSTGGRVHGTYDVTITDGSSTVRLEGLGSRSASFASGRQPRNHWILV